MIILLLDAGNSVLPKKQFSNPGFWRELIIATRFAFVGIIATAIHIAVVGFVLTQTGLTPILANTFAFTVAFGIAFLGHYIWTFRSPGNPRRVMFRFFLIAASAFVANTLILAFFVQGGWFSPVVSAVISASVVPVISFSASRFWGFKGHTEVKC